MTREEAKLNLEWVHTDRETVYKNIDQIFDEHEVQIKAKDEHIKDLQDSYIKLDGKYLKLLEEQKENK